MTFFFDSQISKIPIPNSKHTQQKLIQTRNHKYEQNIWPIKSQLPHSSSTSELIRNLKILEFSRLLRLYIAQTSKILGFQRLRSRGGEERERESERERKKDLVSLSSMRCTGGLSIFFYWPISDKPLYLSHNQINDLICWVAYHCVKW